MYTVNQLSKLASISVRTLHYYDEIGLLKPAQTLENGYRQYGEEELLKLQQILFFRELDFSLEEIQRILASPNFNRLEALRDQRNLIELKKKRLNRLIATIDKTIQKLNNEITMNDQDLYGGLSDEQQKKYAEEAKQRWGHTDAYKESMKRYAKMSKDDLKKIQEEGHKLMLEIVANMDKGATSPEVQKLIARHYDGLRTWYEPNLEMYRGLANMYVDDSRFAAFYEKYAPGLAVFMRDAMLAYADSQTKGN